MFSTVSFREPPENPTLREAFLKDAFDKKVDLSMGVYREDGRKSWTSPVIRTAERILASDDDSNHDYSSPLGCGDFSAASTALILGKESNAIKQKRAFGIQTLGATGALAVGAQFLAQNTTAKRVYQSDPTWDGYATIFDIAGFEKAHSFRYLHAGRQGIDMDGLLEDLSKADENSVVLLQACAHNPTGCDPTHEQWARIAGVMKVRKLFPFFDSTFQGMSSGDLEKDASVVRYFVDQGFELMCAQSYSKYCGIGGQRVGNLTFVVNDVNTIPAILSQLRVIVRGMYLSPACYGSRLVTTILNNPQLFEKWNASIKAMVERIENIRWELRRRLEGLKTPGSWEFITSQCGFFAYTALTCEQVAYLKSKHHIYVMKSGRINVAGLSNENLDYVANSIHDTIVSLPQRNE